MGSLANVLQRSQLCGHFTTSQTTTTKRGRVLAHLALSFHTLTRAGAAGVLQVMSHTGGAVWGENLELKQKV